MEEKCMSIEQMITYDETWEVYKLTAEAVKNQLGTDLSAVLNDSGDCNPATLPDRFLKQVATQLYNFIADCTSRPQDSINKAIEINKTQRRCFVGAMLDQTAYLLSNGDYSLQAGIDLKSGAAINWDRLAVADISRNARRQLTNGGFLYTGLRLY